jgi:hypothetical protein
MKFQVTFKCPDAMYYARERILEGLDKHSDEYWELQGKFDEIQEKFLEYGECVTVEFDLETMEAKVK